MSRSPLLALALLVTPVASSAQLTERLYRDACDDGYVLACNVFGLMSEVGDGVDRDVSRAATFYARACEGGALVGCAHLGVMYQAGTGVERDEERAVGLFRVACEAGDALGCSRLRSANRRRGVEAHLEAGRVVDAETGSRLADAVVEVGGLPLRAVSDDEGRFELESVPPGRHLLHAQRTGFEAYEAIVDVPLDADLTIRLQRTNVALVDEPGRVIGFVVDERGNELDAARVTMIGRPGAALTDGHGRFVMDGVAPGTRELRFTRLGYAPRTAFLVVHPGTTAEVSTAMATRPVELDAIEVSVRSTYLDRTGYYERARRGNGQFLTRRDLEQIAPVRVSELFQRLAGVALQRFDARSPDRLYAVSRRVQGLDGDPCIMAVWIDGMDTGDPDLNQVLPHHIEAIEVYSGAATPIQYSPEQCGAVVIWTRRGG